MKTLILISIVCAFLLVEFLGRANSEDAKYEEGFVATFGKFRTMPQTRQEAVDAGWTCDSEQSDCTNSGKFNGIRCWESDNVAIGLIFDKNGQIAGFQAYFGEDVFANSTYLYKEIPMIQPTTIEDEPFSQITVYLVHPSKICADDTPERDLSQVIDEDVYYQNGNSPSDLLNLPRNRPDTVGTGWDSFECIPQMGWHNIHNSEDFDASNCTKFDPTLALYDKTDGTLIGCGVWVWARSENPSDRHELPPPVVVNKIWPDAPPCILEDKTTSLHMYFVKDPASITCEE